MAKFSRNPKRGGKMVKAWGRLFEVGKSAKYITAESHAGGLRVCAFVSRPVYQINSKGTSKYWYPSNYDIDLLNRLAYPTMLQNIALLPEGSLRKILPNGTTVKC